MNIREEKCIKLRKCESFWKAHVLCSLKFIINPDLFKYYSHSRKLKVLEQDHRLKCEVRL